MMKKKLIVEVSQKLLTRQWKIATAESCTAGGLSYALTSIAGSSAWFERGFITYSNQSKQEMLGVKAKTLETFGAVSQETAHEMAEGALKNSHADLSIAVTGIAGPDGGSAEKPVGTIWIAIAGKTFPLQSQHSLLSGNREEIREQTVEAGLRMLLSYVMPACS